MPGRFFDTNILLYLLSDDGAKADIAEGLLRDGGTVSVQVLNEIANVTQRKFRMSWSQTDEFLLMIREFVTVDDLPLFSGPLLNRACSPFVCHHSAA